MKKILSLLFSGVITFSLCACGQGNSSGSPTDEDLNNAAGNLYLAEVAIDSAASLLLENWTTTGSVMNCYFDESAYEELNSGSLKDRAQSVHDFRSYAKDVMDDAKTLLGTEGTGDFYDAAKNYYLAVNDYYSLISAYPSGYSKLTYSSAISEKKGECQSAFNELTFYTSADSVEATESE